MHLKTPVNDIIICLDSTWVGVSCAVTSTILYLVQVGMMATSSMVMEVLLLLHLLLHPQVLTPAHNLLSKLLMVCSLLDACVHAHIQPLGYLISTTCSMAVCTVQHFIHCVLCC